MGEEHEAHDEEVEEEALFKEGLGGPLVAHLHLEAAEAEQEGKHAVLAPSDGTEEIFQIHFSLCKHFLYVSVLNG